MKKEEEQICSRKRQALSILTESKLYELYPPLSKRKRTILSLYDAVKENSLSFSAIDRQINDGVSLKWLKVQLIEVFSFCGAFEKSNEYQIITLARHIRNKYFYLTVSEMSYFFEAFEDGNYGTFFVGKTVNSQNIMEALKKFENDALLERDRVYNENLNKEREKQIQLDKEKEKKGMIGLQAWYRYCKTTKRNNTKLPGLEFVKRKNSNRNEN